MRRDDVVTIVDDRAGFYMVPSTAIAKARARLSGAHLAEALAGLACLARESFAQHGASREEAQVCEATLEVLAGRVFGVSRARALRIVENLADAGAVIKEAHRVDGVRRLPTKVTFVDLAVSFAYVSGPAFRALVAAAGDGRPPLGPLALYVTLVALGGEQREQFPDGNRRIASASQPELAKLSGLSVTSLKRALAVLKAAGLVVEQPQPERALKTKAVYRLVEPDGRAGADVACGEEQRRPDAAIGAGIDVAATAHSVAADAHETGQATAEPAPDSDRPQPNRGRATREPRSVQDETDGRAAAELPTGQRATEDGPQANSSTGQRRTDGQANGPARAPVKEHQRTTDQQTSQSRVAAAASSAGQEGGGEVEVDRLVDAFRRMIVETLGERRASALYDAAEWCNAARRLLQAYDLERVLAGVDRVARDSLLADKATTLPAFEQIAERAIARAAADRRLAAHRGAGAAAATVHSSSRPSWAAAHELLRQAVSAFGSAGEQRALAFLEGEQPIVAAFARDVGWRTLARSDAQMTDVKFAYLQFRPADEREAAA
jgi:hypothetical protein